MTDQRHIMLERLASPVEGDPAPLRTCPACQQEVSLRAVLCPHCGHWDRPPLPPDRYKNILDPIVGVIMLSISALITVPTTAMVVDALYDGRNQAPRFLFAALWHGWVWGCPALCVVFAWRNNVRNGRPAGNGLWRMYRRSQLFTLLFPFGAVMLVYLVVGILSVIGAGLSAMMP